MTDYKELSNKIRRVGWGFVFILFDINIGTVSILPKWAGYMMIISALPVLASQVPSAKLLKPLGVALAVYSGAEWAMKIISLDYSLAVLSVLIMCILVYFNFQLFTNLAEIAEKHSCPQQKGLLKLRTALIITEVITNIILIVVRISTDNDDFTYFIPIIMGIIQLIMMICICVNIFSLAKTLENYPDTPDEAVGTPADIPSDITSIPKQAETESKSDPTD